MSSRKILLIAVVVSLLVAPVLWTSGAASQTAHAAPPLQVDGAARSVTVTGTGYAFGAPDVAQVGLGVEAVNQDILAAMDQVNAQMNNVTQALVNGGVAAEDIRTEHYSIYQDYSGPTLEGPIEAAPATYRVSTGISITVRNTDSLGELLAAAVEAGANMVNYMQFDIANRSELESEARTAALADARARADQLAAELGLTVGEPLRVVEGVVDPYMQTLGLGGGGGGIAAASSVPTISQGALSVSVSVTVTYALQ
jgi:uncharacterized protein YggE